MSFDWSYQKSEPLPPTKLYRVSTQLTGTQVSDVGDFPHFFSNEKSERERDQRLQTMKLMLKMSLILTLAVVIIPLARGMDVSKVCVGLVSCLLNSRRNLSLVV